KREAARYGVQVLESEIVRLVPSAALHAAAEHYLQIEGFKADQGLEHRLRTSHPEPGTYDSAAHTRSGSSSTRPVGAMRNAFILRSRLLRSTRRTSAVRDMLPCCSASVRRIRARSNWSRAS